MIRAGVIGVLVVEDEPVAADAHRAYVDRTEGFATVAIAGTCAAALAALGGTEHGVDLVLLDMHLPDGSGIDLCRTLRARGVDVDVLAVTSARELATVRAAAAAGVVGYLLKPFTYAGLRDRLVGYARYRSELQGDGDIGGQDQLDRALDAARPGRAAPLPKGMGRETLDAVVAALRGSTGALSAAEAGELIGASRITARRYLEYLADTGVTTRTPRYGNTGRPELEYRWR